MDPDSEREKKREKEEDADGDARLQFRRCVYRSHTRMMGMPTQVLWHRLDPGGDGDPEYPLEWDITGGKWASRVPCGIVIAVLVTRKKEVLIQSDGVGHVAWISGSEVLNVQNIYTGARGRINFVKEMVDRDIVMLREDPKINVQIGDNIVCITLNFYETSEDGYGSGRAAQ